MGRGTCAIAILASLFLAGCVIGPDHRSPDVALPQEWPDHTLNTGDLPGEPAPWWEQFELPSLNQLVERALDRNLDIRVQTARVEEFRARLGLARAEEWPTLGGQADAARTRTPGAVLDIPGVDSHTRNQFLISGFLAYEVDLWGRLARERESAEALLAENRYAAQAVQLRVAADVVTTYFELRAAKNELAITRATIDSRAESFRLQQVRYDGGAIDQLALEQARSEWEIARSQLPMRVQRVHALEGALGILVGLTPSELWDVMDWNVEESRDVRLPDRIPAFLPSELLERRPDIRAAEASLMAATAQIGVAMTHRLPRLNLSAMLGTAAASTSNLFTGAAETWSLAASLTGVIWDFGRSRARTETAEAIAEQAEALYLITVNRAFNEVRDALVRYETNVDRVDATRRLVMSLERTSDLAEQRYEQGFISFLELLDARRSLLAAQMVHEEAARDQLTASATLFKALGGGW